MDKTTTIAWNRRLTAALNASRTLPLMMRYYFVQGRELLATDPPPAELHVLRLATKRVRYTLELFPPVFMGED